MVSKRLWQLQQDSSRTVCTTNREQVRMFCWRVNYDPAGVRSVVVVMEHSGRLLEVWVNENPDAKPFHPFTVYARVEEKWGL